MSVKKQIFISCFCLIWSVIPAFSQYTDTNVQNSETAPKTSPYQFPTSKARFRRYLNDMFGIGALIGTGVGAAFEQIDGQPPEWKKNKNGFAQRFGSNFGQNAVEQTSLYALSEGFHQDQKYRKCDCKNFINRAGYALKSGFIARNKSGKEVFSVPKVISPFIGSVAAVKLWYPKRYTVQDGLRRGGYSLIFNAGFNLIEEFLFKKK